MSKSPRDGCHVRPTSLCPPPSFDLMIPKDDGFQHLGLAPSESPPSSKVFRQLSPLRPDDAPVVGQGLERERFEALLRASRERNAAVGAKRAVDLRKEIALRAHQNKRAERRALFLCKVLAPPSPTATFMPKTPPDSPAIFHYSLPSPGLVSPLAMFEDDSVAQQSCEPWVEQVDFRLPVPLQSKQIRKYTHSNDIKSMKSLPSLDQITARLSTHGHNPLRPESPPRSERRLPAFLQSKESTRCTKTPEPIIVPKPSLSIGVGRLRMPARRQTVVSPQPVKACENSRLLPPQSPHSPLTPGLQITTTVVPRTSTTSPTELSEINLNLFAESRARKSHDMLSTLRRRTTVPSAQGLTGHDKEEEQEERKNRRTSAPPDLPWRERSGFRHSVLSVPGGF
jgi:hypothetical protein